MDSITYGWRIDLLLANQNPGIQGQQAQREINGNIPPYTKQCVLAATNFYYNLLRVYATTFIFSGQYDNKWRLKM